MTEDNANLVELAKKLYGRYTHRRVIDEAFDKRVQDLADIYCLTNRIHPTDIYSTVRDVVEHFECNNYLYHREHANDDYAVSDVDILYKVSDFLEDERQRAIKLEDERQRAIRSQQFPENY